MNAKKQSLLWLQKEVIQYELDRNVAKRDDEEEEEDENFSQKMDQESGGQDIKIETNREVMQDENNDKK